jgi:hypothetical protein
VTGHASPQRPPGDSRFLTTGSYDTRVLDPFLAPQVRQDLEDRLWRPIERRASLEALRTDPLFLDDPAAHPAIFADHGVVHVRDVALGLVGLAATVDGLLLAPRPADRQQFMVTCGVAMAYLHDIGMVDMTPRGRLGHAVYGAQAAHGGEVDSLVAHLLEPGPMRARLDQVNSLSAFGVPLEQVVREVLSLVMAHSKSAVPAHVLEDRVALRALILDSVAPVVGECDRVGSRDGRVGVGESDCGWLTCADPVHRLFADDVMDAVRLLRAADALRQRGTGLRTSGGFEVCMDAATGQAVYTLRAADGASTYALSFHDLKSAGEANIRTATLTPNGHMRVAFHRGSYRSADAARAAARSTAHVVDDIQADVLSAFDVRTPAVGLPAPRLDAAAMLIQLERPGDQPEFAEEVARLLIDSAPSLAGRVVCVADLESAAPEERERFRRGLPVVGSNSPEAVALLKQLAASGWKTDGIDLAAAFSEVCRAGVAQGELLVAAGTPPAFVYVALDHGLTVQPLAGYPAKPVHPWNPVGTTGVIRGWGRNADIVAERDVEVVMIPGELFAREWMRTYTPEELRRALTRGTG